MFYSWHLSKIKFNPQVNNLFKGILGAHSVIGEFDDTELLHLERVMRPNHFDVKSKTLY